MYKEQRCGFILNKHILVILLIVLTFRSVAQTASESLLLDTYFHQLKSLEYEKAINTSKQINNDILKTLLQNLSLKLNNASSIYIQTNLADSIYYENALYKSLNNLNKGYYIFYQESDKSRAYKHFYEALLNAENTQNIPLIKRCLMAMLEFYHYDITQSNSDYKVYLEKYKKLISDNEDKAIYKLYELIFYSSSINGLDKDYFDNAKKLDKIIASLPNNSKLLPKLYFEKALYHELLNEIDSSKIYYELAFNDSKNYPFYEYLRFSTSVKLSHIEYVKGNYKKALHTLESSKNYINKIDSLSDLYYLYHYKSKYLNTLGNHQEAYNLLFKAIVTSEQLNFKKNTIEVAKLKVNLETEQKEKQIIIEQAQKKRFRNGMITLGSLLVLGSIIFFLIQKNTKRKQLLAIQEKELASQKVTTLLKEQELTAIDAMIEGQEKERQRIANDLHDDLGGLMATVKLHFNALKDKQSPELYKKTTELLDEAYNKVRTVAHTKNSGVMAKKGLLKALNDMAKTVSASNQLQVDIFDHGLNERLENSLELTIFRIVQELITNVIKHAEATEASIHITKHEESLNIMVEDNGKGFNTKNITKKSGMGIHSIDKRIENLGGSVTIESELHKGTTVIIDIPS